MENIYDDELMPENFEQIAKAYSKSLKKKGFVFVRLEEEEFNLLLSEVYVLLGKMKACLEKLNRSLNSKILADNLLEATHLLQDKFGKSPTFDFECVTDENTAFLSLVSLENMLIIKLMLLSIKSGELELCNNIITEISSIFAESFSIDNFKTK